MRNRLLLIGGATAVAAVVLLAALLADKPGDADRPARDRSATVTGRPDLTPWSRDQPVQDIDALGSGPMLGEAGATGGTIVLKDGTVVTYQHLAPQPRGVYGITQPAMRRMLSDDRLLVIRASQGTIVAPDQRPREGRFEGDVVVSIYQLDARLAQASQHLTDDDVYLRVFLEEVSFDLELGSIESNREVHVTGPDVDFHGTGLSLIYNDLHNRLQKLEILRGRSARFRLPRDEADGRGVGSSPTTKAATQPAPTIARADEPVIGPGPAAPDAAASSADEQPPLPSGTTAAVAPAGVDFYSARFDKAVHITGSPEDVDMAADLLEAVFSMKGPDAGTSADSPLSESVAAPADPPAGPRAAVPGAPGDADGDLETGELTPIPIVTVAEPPLTLENRSLLTPAEEDIVITWQGRLLVEPTPPPADLATPDDVRLRLTGLPVTIRTGDGETVVGAEAEYLTRSGRVSARGSALAPMVITSPELGTLSGSAVSINQRTGAGFVQGPGRLQASDDEHPLQIQWQDRLDLRFAVEDAQLDALQTANFVGPVEISDPRFQIRAADSLVIDLGRTPDDDALLKRLRGRGDVSLRASESEARWFAIAAQSLDVAFTTDGDGNAYPAHVLAREQVDASGPGMRLEAMLLDVTFEPPQDAQAAASTQPAASPATALRDMPVQRLRAESQVRVAMDDPDVILLADRLVSAGNRLDIFGSPDRTTPARLEQKGAALEGAHLVLHEREQLLEVVGPGTFKAALASDAPAQNLGVTWAQGMTFDNGAGQAQFSGNVIATTRGGDEISTLTTSQLTLNLARDDAAAVVTATAPADGGDLSPSRRVEQLAADGNVAFSRSIHAGDLSSELLSRITIYGDQLVFRSEPGQQAGSEVEVVRVPGPGRMLIQDYRADDPEAPQQARSAVAVSGRGDTLFVWSQGLTLDASSSTMTMLGDVQMVHDPIGKGRDDLVRLGARKLVARLERAGGLGGLTSADQGDVDLQMIRLDDAVWVESGKDTIFTDHLQYTGSDRTIRLWADAGRQVEVHTPGRGVPLAAEQISWDLARDQFNIERVSTGIIPLR